MKRNSYKIALFAGAWWLMASSCFQFRSSDKSQLKDLKKANLEAEIGVKEALGRKIHFTYYSEDSIKPLAVFIHGSPGSSSNFLHYIKDSALRHNFNILLLDRPGFGYSDFGNSEPSLEIQANILSAVVRQFTSSKTVLIGHSLGGPIICRMAMDDADIADALLIVAGSISAELEPQEKWRPVMNKKALRWLMPTSFRVSNQEILPAYSELKKMEPLWSNIRIPVTILQGTDDKLVPEGNAYYGEEVLVNSEVTMKVIQGENHFIPFDDPELIISELMKFID